MDIKKLRSVIEKNMSLKPYDEFEQEECMNEMVKILSDDIASTIEFIISDCTDEEFFWISPVFEDIATKTHSAEFVNALRPRLGKITPTNYNQQDFKSKLIREEVDYDEYVRSTLVDIEYAELALNTK